MKQQLESAKASVLANKALAVLLTILLGGAGTVGAKWPSVLDLLNAPARIEEMKEQMHQQSQRMEARQIILMKKMYEAGHFEGTDPFELFNMIHPSRRVIDSIMGEK